MELSERKEKILCAVIEQYIKTGEPIGSKVLQSVLDISVSSATIRNEMSELANMGLLEQPHTSAGRVPTSEGYRYYVDHLMKNVPIDETIRKRIEAEISPKLANPEKLLERAGELLADMTDCAAVSTMPSDEDAFIKKIEIVPIGTRTAMIVLLTSSGILKTKVCRSDTELNAAIIETFYNLANASFVGKIVADVDMTMLQTLVASLGKDTMLMLPFVTAIADLADEAAKTEIMLEGQSNILHQNNYYGNSAYDLVDFLRNGEPLSSILKMPEINNNNGVVIKIGEENPFRQLKKSSVLTSKYNIDGNDSGTIGIIGPTRIDYAKLIPSVRYLTDFVGRILTQVFKDD